MDPSFLRDGSIFPLWVWLDRGAASSAEVGGKAASLGRLATLNVRTPAAAVLTTAAYELLARHLGLPSAIAEVPAAELARIRTLIQEASLPAALRETLRTLHDAFMARCGPGIALAVRSSATGEDTMAASFAGVHDTVLNVRTPAALDAAVRRVWASLWSEPAVAYRRAGRLANAGAAMAVVVQQLVRSDISFIAFSTDPVHGDAGNVVICASWGLGEALVSGRVVPDHIIVGPDGTVHDYVIGSKQVMTIVADAPEGGTREVPVPRALRAIPALDPSLAAAIATLPRDLSRRLGFPADVEGGIAADTVHVFQVRPVTTLDASPHAGRSDAPLDARTGPGAREPAAGRDRSRRV